MNFERAPYQKDESRFEPAVIRPRGLKRDLRSWPLEWLAEQNGLPLHQSCDQLGLSSQSEWFLPQLVHHFGSWKPQMQDGLVDAVKTASYNLGSGTKEEQQFQLACWKLSCRVPRSKLSPKQVAQPEYSSLVPLILLGLKTYQDVPYQDWSREKLEAVMPPELVQAATVPHPEKTPEEVLEARQEGLLVRSGRTEGQYREPKSTWKLSGISDTWLGQLPYLTQVQIAQIWLAHPDVRHQNMILHPDDWSRMPEPLIKTEVVKKWTAMPWE